MSNIITARNLLTDRIAAAGIPIEQGFMAQFINQVTAAGLICLQPASEPPLNIGSQNQVSSSRRMLLILAVQAGPEQQDLMDDLLLKMRSALLKDNRLKELAPGNHFDLPEGVEFFIPEGADYLFCAEQPITLKYRDEL
jgi:hypothetical protein